MKSLFLKIFLWFWLAMALVVTVIIVTTFGLHEEAGDNRPAVVAALDRYQAGALAAYGHGGSEALHRYLVRASRASHVRVMLLTAEGDPVDGPQGHSALLLSVLRPIAWQAATGRSTVVQLSPGILAEARPLDGRGGRRYVLMGVVVRGWFGVVNTPPRGRAIRVLIVLLTAGLVCYGLARNLPAPVARLREATRRLAAGELSARVGPQIGERRDELADLARDFDSMADRIETLVTAQRRLLSDISHELRSPLARLQVALGLARRGAVPETTAALDRIEREAHRLNDMIGQLLELVCLFFSACQNRQSSLKRIDFGVVNAERG